MADGFIGFLLGFGLCLVITGLGITVAVNECEKEHNVHRCTLVAVPVEVK